MASGKDKDTIDLYDGDIDLLDYGDDLEADLLDGDLAGVGGYDDLELGAEDELELDLLPLDAVSSSTSNKKAAADQNGTTTASAAKEGQGTAGTYGDDVAYDETDYTAEVDASVAEGASSKTNNNNNQSTSNNENWDASPSSATTSQKPQPYNGGQSEAELGGINRQNSSPSDDRSSYSNNNYNNNNNASSSPRGDGRSGGLRGRGNQGYGTGTGRGNYQGGRGGNMLGMGMNQQQIYAMQQMGMNMNMGMGMNGGRYSGSDGYGNQGMGYPYNSGAGMGGNGAGTPGRTIHINPKFQNRAGQCQQDWIVRLVKNNGRGPDSSTKILEMVNRRAEETSRRGLDPKTGSMAIVSTETNSSITGDATREMDVTNRAAADMSEEDVRIVHTAPLEVQNEISAKDCRQAETLAAGQEILQGPHSRIRPCLRITIATTVHHPSLEEEVQDRFPAG
ncbi:hypothetical protein BGX30_010100 [Mortierella sp. GBA39]|nr:hypothetical protein BGX30_010100 [Mortierella sp. GBA39]